MSNPPWGSHDGERKHQSTQLWWNNMFVNVLRVALNELTSKSKATLWRQRQIPTNGSNDDSKTVFSWISFKMLFDYKYLNVSIPVVSNSIIDYIWYRLMMVDDYITTNYSLTALAAENSASTKRSKPEHQSHRQMLTASRTVHQGALQDWNLVTRYRRWEKLEKIYTWKNQQFVF